MLLKFRLSFLLLLFSQQGLADAILRGIDRDYQRTQEATRAFNAIEDKFTNGIEHQALTGYSAMLSMESDEEGTEYGIQQGFQQLSDSDDEYGQSKDEERGWGMEPAIEPEEALQDDSVHTSAHIDPLSIEDQVNNETQETNTLRAPLSQERISEIKAVMSNFALPQSATPEWAKHVPESIWIDEVRRKVQFDS